MRTFACSLVGSDHEWEYTAESAGKAKYQYFRYLRDCDLDTVEFRDIRCRLLCAGAAPRRKTEYEVSCEREAASAVSWNERHPVGTDVLYWTGLREGDGKRSKTRSSARLLSGHTAVVWVEGEAGCISLSHVAAIPGGDHA